MNSKDLAKIFAIPRLDEYLSEVESYMLESIRSDNKKMSELARGVISGGKRLRPTLLIASYLTKQRAIDKTVIACAAAVELLHISTVVHDDIIDHAAKRWGSDTINTKEGDATALLIGDYLLARAHFVASEIGQPVVKLLARTLEVMCIGQFEEQDDNFNISRKESAYLNAIRNKTAALMGLSTHLGAICADYQVDDQNKFFKFGEMFGCAFQIIDDIQDLQVDVDDSGKSTGNDLREGVYTLPIIFSLQSIHRPQLLRLVNAVSKDDSGDRFAIKNILESSGGFNYAWQKVEAYCDQARKTLNSLSGTENMQTFPDFYKSLNN